MATRAFSSCGSCSSLQITLLRKTIWTWLVGWGARALLTTPLFVLFSGGGTEFLSHSQEDPVMTKVCCVSQSVVSDSFQSTRLLRPWDSLGKNTGVVAIPFSRGFFRLRHQTQIYCIAGGFFTIWATREALWPRWAQHRAPPCPHQILEFL